MHRRLSSSRSLSSSAASCFTAGPRPMPARTSMVRGRIAPITLMRCSGATATAEAASVVTELDAESFYPFLENAGSSVVVVDYYTDWCGPCKVFAPRYAEMAQEYEPKGVTFAKFNSSAGPNAKLAMKLGIKQLPTFHVFRGADKQAAVVGAKEDNLRAAINEQLS